jgi:inosine-uridine nucleoside N-ribohydrolase
VDDAIAIHFAVAAGLDVVGLTSCYGNAPGRDTWVVTRELGGRFGVPAFRGADGPGQVASDAVDALLAHEGTVLALAPMTNIAAALLRGARWERLVVLGGTNRRLPNLRPLHTTEFNFACDPAAAAITLERTDVLFPMEVCRQVWFGREEVDALPGWMAERCRHWLQLAPLLTGRPAFHPWDLLPAIWLRFPTLFTTTRARPVSTSMPFWRGSVRFDPPTQARSCEVALKVDSGRFVRFWRDIVTA